MDDIIIKSKKAEDHQIDLTKLFEWLRKYNLKLNSVKCVFGAPAGNLLGFIISKKMDRDRSCKDQNNSRNTYFENSQGCEKLFGKDQFY